MTVVDLTRELAGFADALRQSGVRVAYDRLSVAVQAVDALGAQERDHVYWACRLTFCHSPSDLATFDLAFDAWFAPRDWARDVHQRQRQRVERERPQFDLGTEDEGETSQDDLPPATASRVEILRTRDLAELDREEKAMAHRLIQALAADPPMRRSRRFRPAARGKFDGRRTVRAALRTGGEPIKLYQQLPQRKPRRVVALIDISGSMSRYADSYLVLGYALMAARPGTEVFTLGTRLTRVTDALARRDAAVALEQASLAIPDWSGGTRLGDLLQDFLNRWGQRGMARGAQVVIFSDGWERGSPELLAQQMARLRRLAHEVVWVNPNQAHAGFEPLTGGLQAALPHCHSWVEGHSAAALAELVQQLSAAGERFSTVAKPSRNL